MKTITVTFLLLICFSHLGLAQNGLTWKINPGNAGSVSCANCNPYNGDTSCQEYLPIICITHHNLLPQPSSFTCPNPSRPCWAGGIFTTTIPIKGADLTSKSVGDFQCQRQFGPDSKMAEHHDAWGWVSNGYILSTWTGRGWLWINNQANGNC